MKTKLFLSLCLAFLFLSFAETEASVKAVIKSVRVNGEEIPPSKWNDIIIGKKDKISFIYDYKGKPAEETTILFQPALTYKGYESKREPSAAREKSFSDLSDGIYSFKVYLIPVASGFSASRSIKFEVNERLAKTLKLLDAAKAKAERYKSYSVLFYAALIAALAFLGFGIFFAFSYFKTKRELEESKSDSSKEKKVASPHAVKSEDIAALEKTKRENAKLNAEIKSLREQIDILSKRSENLSEQNRELKNQIDKLRKNQKELEELSKQKDELFALVIHDIKNPASLIKNMVELLKSYDLNANEQNEIIEDILNTTTKIVELSQEVTKILALESSNLKPNYEEIDINSILSDVVNRNAPNAKRKNITIYFKPDETLPICEADPVKIDDVVDNLVSNAIKYTAAGGKVSVKARTDGENIIVDVSDTGQGLSEDDIKQAFKRGTRLSAVPTGGEHSSGLGLWIVKKLVDLHKGKVWVKSAVGKGSTFSFSIPLKAPEETLEEVEK